MHHICAEWRQDAASPSRFNAIANHPVSPGHQGWPPEQIGFVAAEWCNGKKTGRWRAQWPGWHGSRCDGAVFSTKFVAMDAVEKAFAAANPDYNVRWPSTPPQILR